MKPLTRNDLDAGVAGGCQVPDCKHEHHDGVIFLNGKCHTGAGVDVSYTAGTGLLRIECRECGRLIAEVAVK